MLAAFKSTFQWRDRQKIRASEFTTQNTTQHTKAGEEQHNTQKQEKNNTTHKRRRMMTKNSGFFLSNMGTLALSVAMATASWSSLKLNSFLGSGQLLLKCSPILANILFYLVSPFFPRPKAIRSPAAVPSVWEARAMALGTVVLDYFVVGCLFVFCDHVLSGPCICPVTASSVAFAMPFVFSLKDEIQARFIWPRFISRAKLNSWPCCWELSIEHLLFHVPHFSASFFAISSAGFVDFPSVADPLVLVRVWLESMTMCLFVEAFLSQVHRWMHTKSGYFLHKDHHKGKKKFNGQWHHIGLVDHVFGVDIGFPMLLALKAVLGYEPKVHYLSMMLWIIFAFQNHSMNPYTPYFFNPILDYMLRATVFHNLHHVMQHNYYRTIPWSHLISKSERCKDIDLYNKHLKTHFQRDL